MWGWVGGVDGRRYDAHEESVCGKSKCSVGRLDGKKDGLRIDRAPCFRGRLDRHPSRLPLELARSLEGQWDKLPWNAGRWASPLLVMGLYRDTYEGGRKSGIRVEA